MILCFLLSLFIFKNSLRNNLKVNNLVLNVGKHEIEVEELDIKERLDIYASSSTGYTRTQINKLCRDGKVFVNNISRKQNYKVCNGDIIKFEMQEKEVMSVEAEYMPLDILFEDDYIIAVNKPAGMVVHPAPGNPNGTFVNALLYHLGSSKSMELMTRETNMNTNLNTDQSNNNKFTSMNEIVDDDDDVSDDYDFGDDMDAIDDDIDQASMFDGGEDGPESASDAAKTTPLALRPGIVHRLDKGTSGVLIAGKTTAAVSKLSELFAQRNIQKTYLALCLGNPGDTTIMKPIGRSQKNRQMMTVIDEDDDGPIGKLAITHIRTIAFDGKLSAALVRIETGRTHQIRVHFKHRYTPILGDEIYGDKNWNSKLIKSDNVERCMLHAYELKFRHPFTNEEILLKAPLPQDLSGLLRKINGGNLQSQRTAEEENTLVSLIDDDNLLNCDTIVAGRNPGAIEKAGFVPLDRLVIEDEDFTAYDLPEEPLFEEQIRT